MKRTKLFFAAVACFFTAAFVCYAIDMTVLTSQLPESAMAFVQQYFPSRNIANIERDTEFMNSTYEVTLDDGTEIDFYKNGTFDKVDCKMGAVPASIVPLGIQQYVNNNFAGATIVKIDKERYGYDIELSNDIDLKFNHHGGFMYYDD